MQKVSKYELELQNLVQHNGILIAACDWGKASSGRAPLPQHRYPAQSEISPALTLLLQE